MKKDYNLYLQKFVTLLTEHQRAGLRARGCDSQADYCHAYYRSGRKYDKILIANGPGSAVRYFIDKENGNIYGARSRLAPNPKWYFGDIYSAELWDWSDFHGKPVNDDSVRVAGSYAGYIRYIKV